MKSITTIISALVFITGSLFLDIFLSDGNTHAPVLVKQHSFKPVGAHICNEKTEQLPIGNCSCEKQAEGADVVSFRFAKLRKTFSRNIFFTPNSIVDQPSISDLPIAIRARSYYFTSNVDGLPIRIRNCCWLI